MPTPSSGVQSIERAFAVLLAVATEPSGVSEIARRVSLPISTVARLLATLEALAAVERVDDGVTYRIGPTIDSLASGSDSTLIGRARPFLTELVATVHETAGLSVLVDGEVLYLDHVPTDRSVQVKDWTGERAPAHVVSSGLVLLAHAPKKRVDAYAKASLVALTEHSITTAAELRRRLQQARDDGFAWTVDEFEVGITSLAAPITNAAGEVIAALHSHGPSFRFPGTRDRAALQRAVVTAARRLSANLT